MASKPCLPVSKRRKARDNDEALSFENIEAMDATEYLSRVVQQSSRLPEILFAKETVSNPAKKIRNHVPIEGSAASLSYLISDRTAIAPPPSSKHLPVNCKEWVDQTLANFLQLRQYLEKLHIQEKSKGPVERKQPVPPMKDRPGWHIFCLGVKEARGNEESYFGSEDDEQEEEEASVNVENNPESNAPWRNNLPNEGHAPSTSLILQLDQVMVRRVIAHLNHYIHEGWSCSPQRSLWLYSLLARLEKPVHRNDAAVLFGLLQVLTRTRKTLENDRETLARLNVLITVIGIYFEQGGGYTGVMNVKTE